jgi:hypothetical protein
MARPRSKKPPPPIAVDGKILSLEQAAALLEPVGFAEGVLGHRVWSIPAAILRSVAENRQTAVKSCHSSGKTFSSAEAVLWWITRYRDGIAISTAPTFTQVKKLLWGEIRKGVLGARIKYPKPLGSDYTELKLAEGNYALGISTNEGVRFQGFHSAHLLFVLDEAPGVDVAIWEAIAGAAAGGHVSILAIGNPIEAAGPFHDAFTTDRQFWKTFTISAFDTPNLQGLRLTHDGPDGKPVTLGDPNGRDLLTLSEEELDENPVPYLTTRRWVRDKFYEWGPGHPLWDSKVVGEFPEQSEDALVSLRWLEAARISEKPEAGKLRFGLDVAGPGEAETVLVGHRGPRVVLSKSWAQSDPRGDVVAELRPYKDRGEIESINVDSIGIGWGMFLHLRDIFGADIVHAVNVGEAPDDGEHFANLKAELYWGLRQRFKDGDMAGLTDEKTIGQLTSIRYKHNSRGQIVIESKDDALKRGVPSPDRAEAWMLAFAKYEMTLGLLDLLQRRADQQETAVEEMNRSANPRTEMVVSRDGVVVPRDDMPKKVNGAAGEELVKVAQIAGLGNPVTTPSDGKGPTPTCPKCGGFAPLTRLPGNARKCQICGEQYEAAGVRLLPMTRDEALNLMK